MRLILCNFKIFKFLKSHFYIGKILIVFDLYQFLRHKFLNSRIYSYRFSNSQADFSFYDSGEAGVLVASNSTKILPSFSVYDIKEFSIFDQIQKYIYNGMSSSFTHYLLGNTLDFDCRAMCLISDFKLSSLVVDFYSVSSSKSEFSFLFFKSADYSSYYEIRFQFIPISNTLDIYLIKIDSEEMVLDKKSINFLGGDLNLQFKYSSNSFISLDNSPLFSNYPFSDYYKMGFKVNSSGVKFACS